MSTISTILSVGAVVVLAVIGVAIAVAVWHTIMNFKAGLQKLVSNKLEITPEGATLKYKKRNTEQAQDSTQRAFYKAWLSSRPPEEYDGWLKLKEYKTRRSIIPVHGSQAANSGWA